MAAPTNDPGQPSSVYRRFTDPIDVKPTGNVIEYSWYPTAAVRYCEIRVGNRFMGWLWADDSADAAGYLANAEERPDSSNLGVPWELRLRNAKQRGLRPTQALTEASGDGPSALGEAGPLSTDAIPFDELKVRGGKSRRQDRTSDAADRPSLPITLTDGRAADGGRGRPGCRAAHPGRGQLAGTGR